MATEETTAESSNETAPRILTFHRLTTQFTWSVTNYRPHKFESLLATIESAGFSFVPLSEVRTRTKAGERCLAICFDDGMTELVDMLPALMDRFALTPTVFVPSAYVGRPNHWDYTYRLHPSSHLTEEEIIRLSVQGVEFGSHGSSHCSLSGLSDKDLHQELTDSKECLEQLLGRAVDSISYPFGRCNDKTRTAAAEAGYRRGYTMRYPQATDPDLAQGRMAVYSFDGQAAVMRKLGERSGRQLERGKAALANRLAGGTVLWQRLRRLSER